jgi:hypothetical protein
MDLVKMLGLVPFSRSEADRLVGRRVRSTTPKAGVPRGTPGTVTGLLAVGPRSYEVKVAWSPSGVPTHEAPLISYDKREYATMLTELGTDEGDAPAA